VPPAGLDQRAAIEICSNLRQGEIDKSRRERSRKNECIMTYIIYDLKKWEKGKKSISHSWHNDIYNSYMQMTSLERDGTGIHLLPVAYLSHTKGLGMDTYLLARFIGWTLLTSSVAWSVLPIAWLGRPGLLFSSYCLFS